MKAKLFSAVALGAMLATAGSAFAMSLQNDRDHDGGPRSFSRADVGGQNLGGQNLVVPFAAVAPQVEVPFKGKGRGFSLQNERAHDGSR